MKILLIVGTANDVFINAKTKWLKARIPGVKIDIFQFYPSDKQEKNEYADNICSAGNSEWWQWPIIRLLHVSFLSRSLSRFLKGKYYDIIQCHWIVKPLILTNGLHRHCKKLYATFWGGEFENKSLYWSCALYKYCMRRFIKSTDAIINSKAFGENILPELIDVPFKHIVANLGSEPLENLCHMIDYEGKQQSKEKLNIDKNKTTVLIGYSGKTLHRHSDIISVLKRYDELKGRVHLLAPMTRGVITRYTDQVEEELKASGFSYTLLRDRFLSSEEVARLRNATDVVLQLSIFDDFSRSIVECFCAKSVVIYGDWLDYQQHLKNASLVAHPVKTIEEGVEYLQHVVDNLSVYANECAQNSINARKGNLWSECIKDWVNAYHNALSD